MTTDIPLEQKVKVTTAEKPLLLHLGLGGSVLDVTGRRLVWFFVNKVAEIPEIAEIARKHQFALSELATVYGFIITNLMPTPCIDAGGPLLVPTALFLEPRNLDDLLFRLDRDTAGLTGEERLKAALPEALSWAQSCKQLHDEPSGPPSFEIVARGGFQMDPEAFFEVGVQDALKRARQFAQKSGLSPKRSGCGAVLLIAALVLGWVLVLIT